MEQPPVSNQAEEAALIAQAQAGQPSAFDALVRMHQQAVYAVALRMLGDPEDAKDVAQDAFVRAYQGLPAFRRDAKLSTWLVAITMNLCRNRRRWWARRKRLIVGSVDDAADTEEESQAHQVADPAASPADAAERAEQHRLLLATLQTLEQADREVIVLRDIQDYSYEEMARMLGCRLGTVKSRLSRARLTLRARLNGTR